MVIFGMKGDWVETKDQRCDLCALNDICDQILLHEVEAPYICEDGNPFSHKYFKLS